MGTLYDNNSESKHGPFGQRQTEQGPYGGKDADNLSNKQAADVLPPVKDSKEQPRH